MKLAEALIRRKAVQENVEQLRMRLVQVAKVQGLGMAFADLTVTAQGKLCLTADGTSAESVFYGDVADTLASLLRHWVRAKVGLDRNSMLFRDDTRAVLKTLERLEMALGMRQDGA